MIRQMHMREHTMLFRKPEPVSCQTKMILQELTRSSALWLKNGQSPHQIYLDHVDELMCSEKTLYNYVDAQLFDIRNIDLPRKVKYRPRIIRNQNLKLTGATVLNEATLTFKNIWEQTRKRPLYKWIA